MTIKVKQANLPQASCSVFIFTVKIKLPETAAISVARQKTARKLIPVRNRLHEKIFKINKNSLKNKVATLLFLFLIMPACSICSTIKGHIYDRQTGQPLTDAMISLHNSGLAATSGLDGSFTLKNVPAGTYTLVINYSSYKTFTKVISIHNDEALKMEVEMEVKMEPNEERRLKEIIITGNKNLSTERGVRYLEKSASQIANMVSSQAIKVSPDLTVGDLIQRVSGVSIERDNSGNGEYAILRGMDKRYNYTLINGIKIASPDKENRYIPLDIFPSELLDRLEVYKTLTPEMEGDAVGGVVNMVMKNAPDTLTLHANIATGFNEIFFNRDFMSFNHRQVNRESPYESYSNQYPASPADFSKGPLHYRLSAPAPDLLAGFSIGNRFYKDKLGILLTGSFQNTYRGNNSLIFESEVVDTLKGVTLTSMKKRDYSEQELRYAIYSTIDYRLTNKNKIQWTNSFMNLTDFQIRDTKSAFLTIGGYDPFTGNAALEYSTRSRTTRQDIYNSSLQGDHQLSRNLEIDWSAVYSVANNHQPDNATVTLNGEEKNFLSTKTTVENASRRWEYHRDRDLAGYLTLTYKKSIGRLPVEWKTGGLYRDKRRNNFYNEYQFRPVDPYSRYGEDFNDYNQIEWIVENPRGSVGTSLNYKAFEKIAAEFIQFKSLGKKLEITGGVRIESTQQGYNLDFPVGENRPQGKQVYTDVLPGIHLKFLTDAKKDIRVSYFRSINRPGFFEIVPYTIVNEDYVERGNPDLKHAIADNIDMRFEAFPAAAGEFMAGLFYKHIQNPIEYILKPDSIRGQDIYYTPGNFGNASNYGIEIDYIKYFHNIGIKVNYTYTHSSITTTKSKRIREENGNLKTISVNETRPLYGQSAHIANMSVLYKDTKKRWDGQLAVQFTGARINSVSQFVDNDLWQKAFIQMDASIEKKFKGPFGIFVKSTNLLNTPAIIYVKNESSKNVQVPGQSLNNKTLIRQNLYKRSYYLGIRYKW